MFIIKLYDEMFTITVYCQEDLQRETAEDVDVLERVFLEVMRLYPPFLGGRRVVTEVGGWGPGGSLLR